MFQNLAEKIYMDLATSPLFLSGSGWSLDNFFKNLIAAIQKYGGYVLMAVGAAALIWSIVQAFRKYVFQSQEVRTGPVVMILGAVFGAAFMIGGWNLTNTIAKGLNETANEFGGNGTLLINAILNSLPLPK